MRPESRLGFLIALAACAVPLRASAHGPAPAVLEVLAADADGPSWLRATVGLLRRNPDGSWAHVCPALWDGNDRMQAAVASDRPLVVSAEGFLAPADRCEPWESFGAVRHAATDGERLYWVAPSGDALRLQTVEGDLGAVPPEIGSVASLVAGAGRVVVGGRTGLAIWDGGWTVLPLPDRLRYARAMSADAVYGATAADGQFLPERVGFDGTVTLGPPADQLFGPALLGGEMRVFADGAWLAEREGEWSVIGADDRRWTCLENVGGVTYACSLDGLFRLDAADLPNAEPVFRFVQIAPSECALCDPDWAHYGGESGWVDTMAATDPSGARTPIPEGCAVGGAPGGALGAVALLLTRRRRRRRPAR